MKEKRKCRKDHWRGSGVPGSQAYVTSDKNLFPSNAYIVDGAMNSTKIRKELKFSSTSPSPQLGLSLMGETTLRTSQAAYRQFPRELSTDLFFGTISLHNPNCSSAQNDHWLYWIIFIKKKPWSQEPLKRWLKNCFLLKWRWALLNNHLLPLLKTVRIYMQDKLRVTFRLQSSLKGDNTLDSNGYQINWACLKNNFDQCFPLSSFSLQGAFVNVKWHFGCYNCWGRSVEESITTGCCWISYNLWTTPSANDYLVQNISRLRFRNYELNRTCMRAENSPGRIHSRVKEKLGAGTFLNM